MASAATQPDLVERSAAYLSFLAEWLAARPAPRLEELVDAAGGPDKLAIVSVDLIVGFCHSGPLSSPRIASVLPAVADLLERAHAVGVRNIVLTQDTHRPDAEEFESYPPHCVVDTDESRTAPELASLAFAGQVSVIKKNSISSIIEPAFVDWETSRGPFTTYIVVGDCTDLCVYQAAMGLKLRSVGNHLGQRVIVPVNCVETYDLSVARARTIGAEPHDGDLLHHVFLHSMSQNGIEVVDRIC
jgi:nicotinamidase-related amidase